MNEAERIIDAEKTIEKYSDLLFRTCFIMLKNKHDVEDVMQETFIKYITFQGEFASEVHKRAWLLCVSQNKCKDLLRSHKIHEYIPFEEVEECLSFEQRFTDVDIDEFMKVFELSYKYKSAVTFCYIEGYTIEETASILGISASAVKMRLKRAKEKMKVAYEKIYKKEVECNEV